MAYFEIRVFSEDMASDGKPEVLVEFYYQDAAGPDDVLRPELKSAAVISASEAEGLYDTVTDKSDVNGDGVSDAEDHQILFDLANAFTKIASSTFSA